MNGHRTITRLKLQNFLSFDNDGVDLELQPLNVLIGPNGSGKSNFLHAIRLLHCLPNGAKSFVTQGQSAIDYVWKGGDADDYISLDAWIRRSDWLQHEATQYHHAMLLFPFRNDLVFLKEHVVVESGGVGPIWQQDGREVGALRNVEVLDADGKRRVEHRFEKLDDKDRGGESATTASYGLVPFLNALTDAYNDMRIYGTQSFGIDAPPRKSQSTDLDQTALFDDSSNLPNVIEALQHQTQIMSRMNSYLQDFYPNAIRLVTGLAGNQVQLFLVEKGLKQTIPATRLSDGTIRFLCMLALLLHPDPPKVITLEEPELGLHPDVIRLVAKLLVEASVRCQIFVTTHSEVLVSALSDHAEAILICEKEDKGTQVRRLDSEQLAPWLKKYSLGELWMSGEIGGVRG